MVKKKILPLLPPKSFNVETINFTEKRIEVALLGSCHLTREELEHTKLGFSVSCFDMGLWDVTKRTQAASSGDVLYIEQACLCPFLVLVSSPV